MTASVDLEVLAERAVEMAVDAGASDAEAAAQDSAGSEIRVFEGEVESLTAAGARGLGVRAWLDGRVGYSYGTDLNREGLEAIAAGAVEAESVADPDQHAAPPDPGDSEPPEIAGLFDPELAAWDTERKIELAKKVERAAREADDRVAGVETTVYVDEAERAALASSRGARAGHEATFCYAYLQAIAGDSGDRQTGLGLGLGRAPSKLDPTAIGTEAATRSTQLLGAKKPASRTCPVVLDPIVAASFVGFIGSTLCADSVQRGRSPFADRLGDEIASEALTLTDDGLDPGGLATAPVDGEGVPRGATPLIESGRLAAYLHDSYTARRQGAGTKTTANAARSGYRSPPSVSTSNLVVALGESTLEGLLAEASEGMYITDVAGLHSGVNPVSGTFSVGASGLAISAGELADPHTEFTIASDLETMLKLLRAAAVEARWVPFGGSVKTPALLVGEMAVGGA